MDKKPIAFFAAIDDEIRIIRSKMIIDEQVHMKPAVLARGQLDGAPCILVRTGIGKEAMKKAVGHCLSIFDPSFFINVGYAGGTSPYTNAGDVIIANNVIDRESGDHLKPDADLSRKAEAACRQKELKITQGAVVTVNHVVTTPHEKAFIGTEHDADALDMESFAFVEECVKASKTCAVIRAILDPLDVSLPDMGDMLSKEGKTSIGQVAGHLAHHPKDFFSLPKIEYCAMKARESIVSIVEALINI